MDKNKIRVSIDMLPAEREFLEYTQKLTREPTMYGAIRKALKLLALYLELTAKGGKLRVDMPDGTTETIHLL